MEIREGWTVLEFLLLKLHQSLLHILEYMHISSQSNIEAILAQIFYRGFKRYHSAMSAFSYSGILKLLQERHPRYSEENILFR